MFYLVFLFGFIAGIFLNVVIFLLKNGRNMIFGRSFCPECKINLRWYDLVPVLSFFWLKRRCRYCKKKISWQYPIVEILSGLIWILVFNKNLDNFQFSIFNFQYLNLEIFNYLNFVYHIFILSALLVIAAYDFKWKIIPDKIVYPSIIVAFLYNVLNSLKYFNFETFKYLNFETFKLLNLEIFKYINFEIFIYPLFTAIAAFLFFFLIYFFSKGRAMGLGDAKLAFLIGLFLGPVSAAAALMSAFIIGAVFGIILLALGVKNLKSQIAFGPFLVLGAAIAFFFSDFTFKLLNF